MSPSWALLRFGPVPARPVRTTPRPGKSAACRLAQHQERVWPSICRGTATPTPVERVPDLAGWEVGRVPPHVRPELLVLWDVDHTLIENGGVSKETYVLAYELLAGGRPTVPPETDGRTDLAIMDSLLRDNGSDPGDFPLERRWEALSLAGERNRRELAKRGHALPGAEQALKRLGGDPRIVQSALTGNIEANALVKLGTFGLDAALDFEVRAFGAGERHTVSPGGRGTRKGETEVLLRPRK